jgi:demethylmenaquinone methyltransferase/2-methoxy-6-polyprenyl-1,4-benzoquinol methylase
MPDSSRGSASEPTLDTAFASPATKRRYVARLFTTIAGRYDLITRVLSFGLDQRWKARLMELAAIEPRERVLDLACGTGDLAFRAAAAGARVVGLDLAPPMIALARRKPAGARVGWTVGDMAALPVRASTMDVITTAYGLPNVPDLPQALAEIHRVLRPDGRLCALEFNRPEQPAVLAVYLAYLTTVGAALGWLLHRDPDTYRYIPASIRRYPSAGGVRLLLAAAGFDHVRYIPVLGGLMAIHIARKQARGAAVESARIRSGARSG